MQQGNSLLAGIQKSQRTWCCRKDVTVYQTEKRENCSAGTLLQSVTCVWRVQQVLKLLDLAFVPILLRLILCPDG